jgi:hypothetical protein
LDCWIDSFRATGLRFGFSILRRTLAIGTFKVMESTVNRRDELRNTIFMAEPFR